jgi:hypothetical protein
MKRLATVFALALLLSFLLLTSTVHAQSNQIIPGTQVRLTLINGLSSSVARVGDPFTAIVAEPVFWGSQVILPAGAKVHGTVTAVDRPKWFSMFRGGAAMSLAFDSIEVQSRIFPARMSILALYSGDDASKARKDVKTVEGEVVEANHSVRSDVEAVAIGTAGGSTVGLIFSHVLRGTVIGLAGSGAYIATRKGKDIELPAQSRMLVRMDSTVALPDSLLHSASYNPPTGN